MIIALCMLFALATAALLEREKPVAAAAASVLNTAAMDRQELVAAESAYPQYGGWGYPARYGYGGGYDRGYSRYGGYGYGYRPRWGGNYGGYNWGGYGRRNYNRNYW